jgi:hypothetical protein
MHEPQQCDGRIDGGGADGTLIGPTPELPRLCCLFLGGNRSGPPHRDGSLCLRVADAGSFSSAARQLRIGQSAVSKTIARLEDRLGVRLLLRSTRGLTPTEAGSNLPLVDLWAVFPTGRQASAKARLFANFIQQQISGNAAQRSEPGRRILEAGSAVSARRKKASQNSGYCAWVVFHRHVAG